MGAQGSAAARCLDRDDNVSEIICADFNEAAVNELVGELTKARGMKVDAHDKDSILECARGVDLLLNALPLECTKNVLEAALEAETNYQDYAATISLHEEWIESIRIQYEEYGPKFAAIGKLALVGTGSAPGLICCATRDAMKYLDTCDTIYNFVWEGVEAKRFQPFWWSPVTALNDMSEEGYALIDGKLVRTPAFGMPVKRKYDYMDREVTFVEHCHDEPLHYSFNARDYFKGCKNAYFKYAGAGVDFAGPLYRAGLLSREEETYKGHTFVPFDVILSHIPPAPKYHDEIKEILDEGLVKDEGAFVSEAIGTKDGKKVLVETYVYAPGCVESFERAGITGEQYMTGQCGSLFTKMFVNDDYTQTGLISSDMLTYEECDKYLAYAAELDITSETEVIPL